MEIIAYTVVAVGLYFISDWILTRVEIYFGNRFKYRSLFFFAILATLAFSSFALISRLMA